MKRFALPALLWMMLQQAAIVGSWHGTSTCVDREHYPACNNEEVIYDVTAGHSRDSVHVRMDKIVNGTRDFMGESDFGRAADSSWVTIYRNPRVQLRVTLRVRGTHLSGTVIEVGTDRHVRTIELDRR
jgi:hypothetical protein